MYGLHLDHSLFWLPTAVCQVQFSWLLDTEYMREIRWRTAWHDSNEGGIVVLHRRYRPCGCGGVRKRGLKQRSSIVVLLLENNHACSHR